MYDESTTGARLRVLRRWRGMSLDEVAGLAGLSKAFLSNIENGKRALDRRSHISAVASALRVSEVELVGGPHLGKDPQQSEAHEMIPAIRAALVNNTFTRPATERARPLPELVAEMTRIDRSEYKHTEVGRRLPDIIDELHVHVAAPADEMAQRVALETLVEAFQTATFTTKDLGYVDLAGIAAMRADEAARIIDDPVVTGKAASLRIHTMSGYSRDLALTEAEAAADALQPHVSTDASVHVLGMLTLAASLTATVIGKHSRAGHWLDEAATLADRVPDTPGENWGAFSATNVGVWRVSLATERGEMGGTLLALAKDVDEETLSSRRGRHATFLADVGRGLAREKRTRAEAVRWLARAERVAPHKIRNSPAVRETIASVLSREVSAAGGRELRGMASRMGIPH